MNVRFLPLLKASAAADLESSETVQAINKEDLPENSVSVLSYNILAQCLVKRELFPYCDKQTLKWLPRAQQLLKQIKCLDSDIACFQEMGNYEDFFKEKLSSLGYITYYYANIKKQHGCCIALKKEKFIYLDSLNIELDDTETLSEDIPCPKSISTGNVGLVLSIKPCAPGLSEQCFIIGTCHLYWRPNCDYERLRQAHVFIKASETFSKLFSNPSVMICGDFNSQPYKLPYKILTKYSPFDDEQFNRTVRELEGVYQKAKNDLAKNEQLLAAKVSDLAQLPPTDVTPEAEIISKKKKASKKLTNEETLSREIKKLESEVERLKKQVELQDHLMDPTELCKHVSEGPRLISTYATYASLDPSYLSDNWGVHYNPERESSQVAILEPKFTHFTDEFRSTLDYIFLVEGLTNVIPTHVLALPDSSEFGEGLPNQTHPSDHLPIMGIFNINK
ncbi:RNA exonuclease ngl2 [Entomophthora muscae]|uniref:RNA exonuclease ngl2 n=1 Tax=Entomophthora muscae TaxID=34485 RepID=A0ACC2TE21_9FUNG|nr:RNA exonuclease ngl2 [Entomophthora muscae]